MAVSEQSKRLIERADELKQARLPREAKWAEVNRFCGDSDDLLDEYGQLVNAGASGSRRVFTGMGQLNSKRLAALLATYLINPERPFTEPNIEAPTDASAGFITQNKLGSVSQDYLSGLSWYMFQAQMRSKSGFMTSTALALRNFVNFGPGIRFTSMNAQNQARWKNCAVINCWFANSEDGETDTMYRREYYRLSRLVSLFPKALEHKRISELAEKDKNRSLLIEVTHAVEPRAGGKIGAVAGGKPFASVAFLKAFDGHVLREDGFDTFPYSVAVNGATESNPYGYGIAEAALPDLEALNHYQAGLENNVDLINEPPILHLAGLFNKFSFDAGALTSVDPFNAGGFNISEAVTQLKVAGQIQPVMGFLQWLENRIGEYFYTDFLKLGENGTMTATEVNDRRDLRLRSVASLVPGIGPMFSTEADRLLELMVRRRLLPSPPPELRGREVVWDYRGPLWNIMKGAQGDIKEKVFAMWQGLIKESPEIADIIDIEAVIRSWADDLGLEPGNLRSAEDVKALAKQRADAKAREQEQNQMTAQATAARDAAQGVASLANAGDGRGLQAAQEIMAA
ncbi:portal protein [Asticcacaulis taihuensis]|uniref:portal protein n=1 Tax=Asticcacaulis taihuensis TaxID=260084 RepID=UPI0026F0D622|nr:portal protein [Asticcacaulis taihuensis]